jgi:hypothetical protein
MVVPLNTIQKLIFRNRFNTLRFSRIISKNDSYKIKNNLMGNNGSIINPMITNMNNQTLRIMHLINNNMHINNSNHTQCLSIKIITIILIPGISSNQRQTIITLTNITQTLSRTCTTKTVTEKYQSISLSTIKVCHSRAITQE